jgi:hypothetical protein
MPSFSRRRGRCFTTASGVPIVPPDALATGSTLAPQAFAYADPALLLGLPEVEVVAICAPPDRHVALVLAAVVAGKHIVCDKPLGVSHNARAGGARSIPPARSGCPDRAAGGQANPHLPSHAIGPAERRGRAG